MIMAAGGAADSRMADDDALNALRRDWGEAYEIAQQVEREFPGWHVWISSLGRWWAVRQGPDAHHGRDDQRPMTLDADDAAGLRMLLARQAAPERQP
jgi:hypothetical protein